MTRTFQGTPTDADPMLLELRAAYMQSHETEATARVSLGAAERAVRQLPLGIARTRLNDLRGSLLSARYDHEEAVSARRMCERAVHAHNRGRAFQTPTQTHVDE